MAKRSRAKIRLDFRTSENFELVLWPTRTPQRSIDAYSRVHGTLLFPALGTFCFTKFSQKRTYSEMAFSTGF